MPRRVLSEIAELIASEFESALQQAAYHVDPHFAASVGALN
jgi:hypothetical protein